MENLEIKKDLETVLKTLPSYLEILLQQTMMLAQMFKMGRSPKRITAKNIITLVQFSQNLMQGGWIHKDHFTQLPQIKEAECKTLKHNFGGKTLNDFCKLGEADQKTKLQEVIKENFAQKYDDIRKCLDSMPVIDLKLTAFVEGEQEVAVNDILTCKLEINFKNLVKGEKSGFVHSNYYPYLKRDNWFLIITDKTLTNLATVEKLTIQDNYFVKEFKERVSKPGMVSFIALLINDSYRGLDQMTEVSTEVVAEAKNRVQFEYSKEDIKAIKQANMLQAALDMGEEETDDDEDNDLNEEEELKKKLRAAGLRKAIGEEEVEEEEEDESKKEK